MAIELNDGVYFSYEKPRMIPIENFSSSSLLSTDYYCEPYGTDYVFVWKSMPKNLSYIGQGNYGSTMLIKTIEPGYITVCMEND
jgi:hypothetical protein